MKRYLLLLLCLIASYANAMGEDYRTWPTLYTQGELPGQPRVLYSLLGQLRLYADGGIQQSNIMPGVGYQVTKRVRLWGGYRWANNDTGDDETRPDIEQRIWERFDYEILHNTNYELISFSALEERKANGFGQIALRFRQKFNLDVPKFSFYKFTPRTSDEIFIDINHPQWTANKTFQQNRFILGIVYKFTKVISLETSYLNQLQLLGSGNEMNHIAYLSLNFIF